MDNTPEFTTPSVFDDSALVLLAIAQAEEEQHEAGEEVVGATEEEISERIASFDTEDYQRAAIIASRLRLEHPDLGSDDLGSGLDPETGTAG
jgi:hypothetical protein